MKSCKILTELRHGGYEKLVTWWLKARDYSMFISCGMDCQPVCISDTDYIIGCTVMVVEGISMSEVSK